MIRDIVTKLRNSLLGIALVSLLNGCLSDGSSSVSSGQLVGAVGSSSTNLVSGVLMKGPVGQAEIDIYLPNNLNGNLGAHLAGPFLTDANGRWSGSLPLGVKGIVLVKSSGGHYTDEATGKTVSVGSNVGFITAANLDTSRLVILSPWSYATYLAAKAGIVSDFNTAIMDAIGDATTSLGFNPITTDVQDPSGPQSGASPDEKKYAALIAAFAQMEEEQINGIRANLAKFTNTNRFELALALAEDVSNGRLDGLSADSSTPVFVSTGQGSGNTSSSLTALNPNSNVLGMLGLAADSFVSTHDGLRGVPVIGTSLSFNIQINN